MRRHHQRAENCFRIWQALKLCGIAELYGVECMIGCMLEAKISVTAAVHLACAKQIITKIDLDGPVLCREDHILGGALFLLLALLINGLSSCTPLLQGGLQALVIATYPAEDEDILAAERYYKGLEDELQQKIDRYAAEHPQYDEPESGMILMP